MWSKRTFIVTAAVVTILILLQSAAAQEQPLKSDLTAMLTLKVLTFDRNLAERSGSEIVVGILYTDADKTYAKELKAAFDSLKGKKVNGIPFKAVSHQFLDSDEVTGWMKSENISVLFISPKLLGKCSGIQELAAEKKCLTAGPSSRFPETCTSLGFEISGGKPRIVIHRKRSQQEGVDFSASLLQIARVL